MASKTAGHINNNNNHNKLLRLLATKVLLGPGQDRSGDTTEVASVHTESLCGDGRILGLYFAAQWCPACRTFTPELKSFYESVRKGPKGDGFEIVFLSWDNDETQFREHFSDMPWTAFDYQDRAQATQLAKMLRVVTIPTLILLDGATGTIITRNGRTHVTEDPGGTDFPWRPSGAPLEAVLLKRGPFVDATGQVREPTELEGHIKCLYFSAHWCPPCKAFTPQLVNTYSRLKSKGHKFEVVFISSDRSQESFDQYFGTMPWLAIPYAEEQRRKDLAKMMGVQGIPTLIIVDENNEVLTRNGRYEVADDPEGNNFPWRPGLVEELTYKCGSELNDPLLILFTDGNQAELKEARTILLPVAEELTIGHEDGPLQFFVGGEADICDHLREYAELEDEVPLLVILEMTNRRKYVLEDDVELTPGVVRDFVRRYLEGTLQPKKFPE